MKLRSRYHDERVVGERSFIVLLLLFGLVLMPEIAAAAPWDSAARQVLGIFQNGLIRLLGVIAIIGLGIAALAGKLPWNWAINIVIGIVLMFGAAPIVDYLSVGALG